MQRTQIYLPKSQLDHLRKRARDERATVSEVIRTMLSAGLVPNGHVPLKKAHTLFSTLARVKRLCERGPRDLATNLDAYLYSGK